MNLTELSTNGLRGMLEAVRIALATDNDVTTPLYRRIGVRENTGDWRRWADALQVELSRRNETFIAIDWT